jgi:hypothetical protein
MSILKKLEDSNVNENEIKFLNNLLLETKKLRLESMQSFDKANAMLELANFIYKDALQEDEKILKLKKEAEELANKYKEEMLLLDSLIEKLNFL